MMRALALVWLLLPQEKPANPLPEGVTVEKDLTYAQPDGKELKLDVYRKDSPDKRPAVVWIHGGGWRSGDKKGTGRRCGWLAGEGYVVFSVNYRLSGEAKYPAQIEDCQNAVRWVRRNAEKYKVNPDKIAAAGDSAGGHLAMLVGVKDGQGCRVQAVVSYYGAHDLNSDGDGNQDAPLGLIGAPAADKPDAWKDAKCSTHISEDDPPVLMLHGDQDKAVPPAQSEKLLPLFEAKKVPAQIVIVKGAGHGFGGKTPHTPTVQELDAKVVEFLGKHLK